MARNNFALVMEAVNLDEWVQYFEGLEAESRVMLNSLLVSAGAYMHREASLRPAEGGRMPYLTGTLQASLSYDGEVKREGGVSYVEVTTNVEYAPYQEYGFRTVSGNDVPGKGFMRHGVERAKIYLETELRKTVEDLFT